MDAHLPANTRSWHRLSSAIASAPDSLVKILYRAAMLATAAIAVASLVETLGALRVELDRTVERGDCRLVAMLVEIGCPGRLERRQVVRTPWVAARGTDERLLYFPDTACMKRLNCPPT